MTPLAGLAPVIRLPHSHVPPPHTLLTASVCVCCCCVRSPSSEPPPLHLTGVLVGVLLAPSPTRNQPESAHQRRPPRGPTSACMVVLESRGAAEVRARARSANPLRSGWVLGFRRSDDSEAIAGRLAEVSLAEAPGCTRPRIARVPFHSMVAVPPREREGFCCRSPSPVVPFRCELGVAGRSVGPSAVEAPRERDWCPMPVLLRPFWPVSWRFAILDGGFPHARWGLAGAFRQCIYNAA